MHRERNPKNLPRSIKITDDCWDRFSESELNFDVKRLVRSQAVVLHD